MFSDQSVKVAASNFVAVKIDPRKTQDAMEHKRSRYVPELVVLDPSQNFVTTIPPSDPASMRHALEGALTQANKKRR